MHLLFDSRRNRPSQKIHSHSKMHDTTVVSAFPIMSTVDVSSLENTIRAKKRSRKVSTCIACSSSSPGLWATMLAVMTSLMLQHQLADAFPVVLNDLSRQSTSTMLRAVRSEETLQLVRPRAKISQERRDEAVQAMKRKHVESALDGVDAQMLELLSEGFLYPNKPSPPKPKPRGRPDFVPGAMSYDTAVKFREQREAMDLVNNRGLSAIAAYINPNHKVEEDHAAPQSMTEDKNGATATKGRQTKSSSVVERPKRKPKGGAQPGTGEERLLQDASGTKKRKRVVKNLPEPRDRTAEERSPKGRKITSSRSKLGNLELQKYYRTELLTAKEEYSLGLKVQLMMKCEQVHEGLAIDLLRLPTIEEWAGACGFDEADPLFVEMEGDQQIRPAGSDDMFHEPDPNSFVGNGLAESAGPGRGRGRAKKPPPIALKNFYDDSELRDDKNKPIKGATAKRKALQPANRGTPQQFVEMMMSGREAKQRMVQCNMRLVVSIARKYSNVGVNLQDLVQEGSLGLSRAAEKFDPSKGFKFSTYASWWIQQAVFRSIAYHSRTIRLPVHVHNLLNRVRKVRAQLERGLGRPPTNEEMADELDMTLSKYNKMLRLTRRSISLEVPKYQSNPKDLGHESDDLLGDTISRTGTALEESTPETRVDRGLFQDDLRQMLEILNEDERSVIISRYGLADGLTRTVTAVASQMKQSKAWVRSQECRALRKLRRPWYEKKLKEHQTALTA